MRYATFRLRARRGLTTAIVALLMLPAAAALGPPAHARQDASALLEQAKAADKVREFEKAAGLYQRAVDMAPADVAAHEGFMAAVRSAEYAKTSMATATTTAERRDAIYAATAAITRRLVAVYEQWTRRFPDVAAVRWGFGRQLADEPARAAAAFQRAVALDARFARAYVELARAAEMRDNRQATRDYYRKAADADPENDYYAYLAVNAIKPLDRQAFAAGVDALIAKFPQSQWSSRALLTVAQIAPTPEVRAEVLERHLRLFPSQAASSGSAAALYEVSLGTNPARSLELANQAAAQGKQNASYWAVRVKLAEGMVSARTALSGGRPDAAQRVLESLTIPDRLDSVPVVVLKAQACERAGHLRRAWDLLVDAAATWPDTRLIAALSPLGARLEPAVTDVDAAIWSVREQRAQPMQPFDLAKLGTDGRVTLASLRGQVVLVNFWFPT